MDWSRFVDTYCERTEIGFLNEPLNLFSNVAFFIAAIAIVKGADGKAPRHVLFLAGLLAAVGFGSSTFHAFSTVWANCVDVICIGIFVVSLFGVHLYRVLKLRPLTILVIFFVFLLVTFFLTKFLDYPFLHRSNGYFGPALALSLLALYSRRTNHPNWDLLTKASAIFIVVLLFRTVDEPLCQVFPWGTHFLWHIGVAMVAYYATLATFTPAPFSAEK